MLTRLWGYMVSRMTKKDTRMDPVIFVIGCTGTGKSDLGVEIARKYDGEVISSDSMQIYQGLDIATNKVTAEETRGVPHHLMSFVAPSTSNYHVHHFRQQCLAAIEDIRSRSRVPVVVGGTTYFVESVLFTDNFIETDNEKDVDNSDLLNMTKEEMYALLKQCDPESANLVHPNNTARVRRAIEIYRLTGTKKSQHIKDQLEKAEDGNMPGATRFPNTLVMSLDASKEVLNARLDSRVDKMKRLGLMAELEDYYDTNSAVLESLTHGVMQCIGLKEFLPWLRLSLYERRSDKGLKLFEQGCNDVKLHTRQYARRQRNWFKSRLVKRRNREQMPSVAMLDTSDKETFMAAGMDIVDSWMHGEHLVVTADEEKSVENTLEANVITRCEHCDILVAGANNWKKHLAGKKHKATVRIMKERIQQEAEVSQIR